MDDILSLALTLSLRNSLRSSASRLPVTLLVMGQSTEADPVPLTDKAAWPNAFVSQRNPGFMEKRLIPVADRGGWWAKVYDDMWDWGYDLDVINAGVGGASIEQHIIGYPGARQNSYGYYQKRAGGLNYPDLGDFGDIYQLGGKYYNVTTGRKRQVFNSPPHEGVVGTSVYQDFVAFSQTAEASAAAAPDLSALTIGQSAADGTLTVTRLNEAYYISESVFYPGIDATVNGGLPNRLFNGRFGEGNAGRGYDPLGIIVNAYRMAQQAAPAELKILYFSQGQSDLGISALGYQYALMMLVNFFLRRGWIVVIGNTIYSPGSSGSTATNYNNQVAGVDGAIAALLPSYPGKVYRGANLYATLGTTGAMGGQRCTAGVSGNTLTVSAVTANQGSGIAVGQNVWNGQALVGVVTALGTGAGGTGTYTLDRTATIAAGTALICAGSGLQYDAVHQNGSIVAAGGGAIANSLKAFLPRRRLA